MTSTLNIFPSHDDIADATMRLFYNDLATPDDIRAYFAAEMMIDIDATNRDMLANAIDTDLRDMMHNANLDFYASLDDLDKLTDDQYEMLADNLLDFDAFMIADCILARIAAI